MDTKRDGVLDEYELRDSFHKIYSKEETEQFINDLYKGKALTYTQFLTRAIDRKMLLEKSKIDTAFKLIDRVLIKQSLLERIRDDFGRGVG